VHSGLRYSIGKTAGISGPFLSPIYVCSGPGVWTSVKSSDLSLVDEYYSKDSWEEIILEIIVRNSKSKVNQVMIRAIRDRFR